MKLRNIILMITIVITYGCGFSSIYSNNNYNFSIEKITFQGDNALNNYTRSKNFRKGGL